MILVIILNKKIEEVVMYNKVNPLKSQDSLDSQYIDSWKVKVCQIHFQNDDKNLLYILIL